MKKLFGETKISWKFLIIFSTLIGIGVGVLNRIPLLNNTSFQDMAIDFNIWIILAIFIIINCENWKEAVGKCFVFFLITQPLIYLSEIFIDVAFYNVEFNQRFTLYFSNYYIHNKWFLLTILTIPGAFIAYQVKRNDMLSAIILSVATTFLAFEGTKGLINTIFNVFPYHLINDLFCLFFAYYLIFVLLKNKKERIISTILTSFGIITAIIAFSLNNSKPILENIIVDLENGEKAIECSVEDENVAKAEIEDGTLYVYTSEKVGTTQMTVKSANGSEYVYKIESTSKGITANLK